MKAHRSRLEAARERIGDRIKPTPIDRSETLSRQLGADVHLKMELFQTTGSFKLRGAFNRLLQLSPEAAAAGVVTTSAGNHAQALAKAASDLGMAAYIFMPETTPLVKIEATQGYGAEVHLHGKSFEEAFEAADRFARERGKTYVHGFDDWQIVYGAGSVGLEILEALPDIDTLLCPVGGGGLVSGVALAAKSHDPSIEIVGVQSSHVPGMAESITRGERIEAFYRPTIAEGIAIKRPGKINFEICRNHVDRFLQVDDDAIAQAILFLMERCKVVAEGAGAAALAPLLVASNPARWKGRKICVIVSGGNIDFHTISSIITRGLSRSGRFLQFSAHVPDTPGHLKKLVDGVSAVKGNILDITHDRTAPDLPLGYVKINIILETRNKAHGQQIVSDLSRLGYPIREIT